MFEFEHHDDLLLVLPALCVTAGECSDAECGATHWRISIGWLLWSLDYSW